MRHRSIASFTALAACATGASAQSFQQLTYSVSHSFNFQPAGDVVDVQFLEFRHAWVRAFALGQNWGVFPAQTDPQFDPFGTDTLGTPFCFNSGLLASPVPCDWQVSSIPPTGANSTVCMLVEVLPSHATACNSLFVAPYSTTPPIQVQGSFGASGAATAVQQFSGATNVYAFSSSAVYVRGGVQLANGTIQWNTTVLSDSVGGGASAQAVVDPVHIIATNLNTGTVVDRVLLGIDMEFEANGVVEWDPAGLSVDAAELSLSIDIPAGLVAPGQSGTLDLRVEGGVVTVSTDSGRFDGVLPPAGTAAPFAVPLPPDFPLDYDLGLNPADPWDVQVFLSGGGDGSASARLPPCPADINGDGVLNLDDVDAFIGAFLDGDTALADLDDNGLVNLDDLDLFVESFLSGCPSEGGGG